MCCWYSALRAKESADLWPSSLAVFPVSPEDSPGLSSLPARCASCSPGTFLPQRSRSGPSVHLSALLTTWQAPQAEAAHPLLTAPFPAPPGTGEAPLTVAECTAPAAPQEKLPPPHAFLLLRDPEARAAAPLEGWKEGRRKGRERAEGRFLAGQRRPGPHTNGEGGKQALVTWPCFPLAGELRSPQRFPQVAPVVCLSFSLEKESQCSHGTQTAGQHQGLGAGKRWEWKKQGE